MSETKVPYLSRGCHVFIKEIQIYGRLKSYQKSINSDKIYVSVEYFEHVTRGRKSRPKLWFGTLDQIDIQ